MQNLQICGFEFTKVLEIYNTSTIDQVAQFFFNNRALSFRSLKYVVSIQSVKNFTTRKPKEINR